MALDKQVDIWESYQDMTFLTAEHEAAYKVSRGAFEEMRGVIEGRGWEEGAAGKFRLDAHDGATGDKVYSTQTKHGRAFAAIGKYNTTAEKLFMEMWNNIHTTPSWNKDILQFTKLYSVGSNVDITYTVFADVAGGLISSRDFVDARCWCEIAGVYFIGLQSVQLKELPPQKGKVRGHDYPGVLSVSPAPENSNHCVLEFIRNFDLKGMLPKAIVDRVTAGQILIWLNDFRKQVE